jgi:hypothetical protein
MSEVGLENYRTITNAHGTPDEIRALRNDTRAELSDLRKEMLASAANQRGELLALQRHLTLIFAALDVVLLALLAAAALTQA